MKTNISTYIWYRNNYNMEQLQKSVFETLNAVNCNEHTEKKGQLTYLSWAWAWAEVKKRYPAASYTIYEDAEGRPYFTDGRTCWVKTGVTIEGLEHIEYLPVMDARNNSLPVERVTSFDMNKAIQRSLTKACARHGLGLYIYAGEDLPEDDQDELQKPAEAARRGRTRKTATAAEKTAQKPEEPAVKKTVTDENIKQIVDWVCKVPEGPERDARKKKAEDSYEWPGNLMEAFRTMVDFTE